MNDEKTAADYKVQGGSVLHLVLALRGDSDRMSYQLYRNTTLGHTLQEALDELMQMQMLSPALALRVLVQFDKSINSALNTRVKNKLNFKAEKLNTYRFCDNVWTFMLNDVEFREINELGKIDRVKIVACDAKSSALTTQRYEDN